MIKDGQDGLASDFVIQTTAGEALSARDAVYISSADGKAYKCDADDPAKIGFVGFAQEAAILNAAVNIVQNGLMTGFSGLTTGSAYFLSGTAGGITLTPPAGKAIFIGVAVSATVIKMASVFEKAKVCVGKSSGQSVVITTAQVTFDTEDINIGGNFASNQFTAPRTGIYLINFFCSYDSNASTSEITDFEVRVNGTAVFRGQSATASNTAGEGQQVTISALKQLTASDVVTVYCHTSGHTAVLLATTNTKLSILEI